MSYEAIMKEGCVQFRRPVRVKYEQQINKTWQITLWWKFDCVYAPNGAGKKTWCLLCRQISKLTKDKDMVIIKAVWGGEERTWTSRIQSCTHKDDHNVYLGVIVKVQ